MVACLLRIKEVGPSHLPSIILCFMIKFVNNLHSQIRTIFQNSTLVVRIVVLVVFLFDVTVDFELN
jgi:DNA-binding XRE family transcriptional regulator